MQGLGDCFCDIGKLLFMVGGHDTVLKSTFKEKTCARHFPVVLHQFKATLTSARICMSIPGRQVARLCSKELLIA